jgi:hypothetical protein
MKKRETLENLLKLVGDLPLKRYESPGVTKKIEDLLKLIEGQPVDHYAAPSAVGDIVRKFDVDRTMATKMVRFGTHMPGAKNYNYGYGILLCEGDRDSLIKCLRHILYAKRGAPLKDENAKLVKAWRDRNTFEGIFKRLKSAGIKAPKTRAYEILETKWNLTNRQVRNRISAFLKLV